MAFLVFCNPDENGEIEDCLCGERVIPDKEYGHFFFLQEEIDLTQKKVIDSKLLDKE